MGRVYKVRNELSDRVEAMKICCPIWRVNADLANRFLREIKTQAGLDHPNIAKLYTALRIDNQLLMCMELVEGITLDERLRTPAPFPWWSAWITWCRCWMRWSMRTSAASCIAISNRRI